jgi:hypothetical protein
MSALLFLAAAASLAPSAALNEFNQRCSKLDDFEAISERAIAAGWQPSTPEAGSVVARYLALEGSFRSNLRTSFLTQTFIDPAKQGAVLVLLRREVGDRTTIECQLQLPEAQTAPSDEELQEWAKRRASRSTNENGQRTWWWEPGVLESHSTTGVTFVAASSRVREMLPVAGLRIVGRRTLTSN